MEEKKVLLEEVSPYIEKSYSLSLARSIIVVVLFSFTLLIPKIYISSYIYILSVKFNKKLNEFYSLRAENLILKAKIEKIKFKNRLNLDTF